MASRNKREGWYCGYFGQVLPGTGKDNFIFEKWRHHRTISPAMALRNQKKEYRVMLTYAEEKT